MGLIERKRLETRWPDSLAVENATQTLFERLKIVRELNKRHIQRRAFIDLQKYFKEQGMQHNFQSTLLPMLLETQIVTLPNTPGGADMRKYYLKAHELMMMLENASEAENAGPQHMRNMEIIRVRGFSQSLVQKILTMNQTLREASAVYSQFNLLERESQTFLEGSTEAVVLSQNQQRLYTVIVAQTKTLLGDMKQQLAILG